MGPERTTLSVAALRACRGRVRAMETRRREAPRRQAARRRPRSRPRGRPARRGAVGRVPARRSARDRDNGRRGNGRPRRRTAGGRAGREAPRARPLATVAAQDVADKRRLLNDAAVRLFARKGYHACRVSDIAAEAGVAHGLLYHYFDSKEEVLRVVVSEAWAEFTEALQRVEAQDVPAREQLRRV